MKTRLQRFRVSRAAARILHPYCQILHFFQNLSDFLIHGRTFEINEETVTVVAQKSSSSRFGL
jgi:hypothetical protein